MSETTIAAISTAQGSGGIAVIRISGESAIEIADRVFVAVSGRKLSSLKGYTASFGHIYSGGEKLDEAVATVFRAPHSYTGEDVVELSCHGGVFIAAQVLRAVLDSGAKPAEAGEFTKRAFLNGKTDLTAAEAVISIIGAKSRTAARAALNIREGALRRRIDGVKELLLNTAAHLNAWADYPEEDIDEVDPTALLADFEKAQSELSSLLQSYDRGQAVMEGIDTVIAGRPNVGKSTIMNLLAGREKSIVTPIAGTTRDIIEETVVLGDVVLKISDTAGLRRTENEVERIGVDLARKRLKSCAMVLAVFDASVPLNQEDEELLQLASQVPFIAVINKCDLEAAADLSVIEASAKHTVKLSAANGSGLDSLTQTVAELAGAQNFDPSEPILANERQRQSVLTAYDSLCDASKAITDGMTLDAVTVSLEDAVSALLELTGERTSDAVIDKVFHNFCVGK